MQEGNGRDDRAVAWNIRREGMCGSCRRVSCGCVADLHELPEPEKRVQSARIAHEELPRVGEEVQLDAQLLHVAPGAARDQVLEEAELGALCVHRHQVQRALRF